MSKLVHVLEMLLKITEIVSKIIDAINNGIDAKKIQEFKDKVQETGANDGDLLEHNKEVEDLFNDLVS